MNTRSPGQRPRRVLPTLALACLLAAVPAAKAPAAPASGEAIAALPGAGEG